VPISTEQSSLVSIHAPARGATFGIGKLASIDLQFQSTHPRGVRLKDVAGNFKAYEVSIHAPARGATPRETRL